MLSAPVSLAADAGECFGAIDDLEKFANDAVNGYHGRHGGYSNGEPRRELLSMIFLVSVRCKREYDPACANGLSFPTYVYRTIQLRITDHFRKLGGDRRYGPRPVVESIELRIEELSANPSVLELLDEIDTSGLTPQSEMMLRKVVRHWVELGLKHGSRDLSALKNEVAESFGWDRRELNRKLTQLQHELTARMEPAAA